MKIFVAKLNYETNEEALRAAFEQFGEVESVKIVKDQFTGRSKGYGFVEMPIENEGNEAIKALDNSNLAGRTIIVKKK